jgi:molybdate transport system substrate-binding protein
LRLHPHATKTLTIILLATIALITSACSQSPNTTPTQQTAQLGEVTVFAASSLVDALGEIKTNLEAANTGKITYNFAGSQALATQLAQGAKADVFASADARNMDAAVEAGAVVTGTQRLLVTNGLIVAAKLGGSIATLHDLANPGLKLVLAKPSVPVGNYTLQALDKLSANSEYGPDFKDKVLSNVVSQEDNVRQVVAKIELGEADAGIVYTTDALSGKVETIEIPAQYNVIARYLVAPLKGGPNPGGAQKYIDYLLSDEGQSILAEYGFGKATDVNK